MGKDKKNDRSAVGEERVCFSIHMSECTGGWKSVVRAREREMRDVVLLL